MLANGIAQRRLCRTQDGLGIILYLKACFLGIPDHPKQNGVNVNGNRVSGQRLLGGKRGRCGALVDMGSNRVDERNAEIRPRTCNFAEFAETQDNNALPLGSHAHAHGNEKAGARGEDKRQHREGSEQTPGSHKKKRHNKENDEGEPIHACARSIVRFELSGGDPPMCRALLLVFGRLPHLAKPHPTHSYCYETTYLSSSDKRRLSNDSISEAGIPSSRHLRI